LQLVNVPNGAPRAVALVVSAPSRVVAPSHAPIGAELESSIIAALDKPAAPGETASEAFRRKEQEVGDLFAAVSIADARELHRRLTLAKADDPIARRFTRLVRDRQARLIAFLADARRRAALASARRG
jgi:hypothetical protein